MVVTLPFVLLLLDYWPLGRTRWAEPVVGGNVTAPPNRLLVEKLPLFALAAASGLVTLWGQRTVGATDFARVPPLGMKIANAPLSYVGYIGKTVWPTGLAVFYPLPPGLSATAVMGAGVGLIVVTAAVIGGARRRPWLVTGWFWYLGMLVPVIGLLQGAGESMADRFTYLPSIGLLIMLCWSVPSRAMERWNLKVITCIAAAAVVAVCAALSRVQLGYWKNSETLFRHALDVTRDNWLAHCNLARASEQAGRIQDAISHYEQALQISPDFAKVHNNLGNALLASGKTQEAIGHFEQALRLRPDLAGVRNNLAAALAEAGRLPEAIERFDQVVRITPGDAEAHYNLGLALAQAGRIPEAIEHLEQALRIKPDFTEARNALARLQPRQ